MSHLDAVLSSALHKLVPCFALLGLCLAFLYRKIYKLKQRWFAWLTNALNTERKEEIGIKRALFAELQCLESCDSELRRRGLIRILEIGAGSGTNCKYFPRFSYLNVVECNPYSYNYFISKVENTFEVQLETFIVGFAENLIEFGNDSIDAVVSTKVLCTVKDVKRVLEEIKRVLTPGGKFFYVEHVCHHQNDWRYTLQKCVNPIWSIMSDGCNLTRDLCSHIKAAKFSSVDQVKLEAPWGRLKGILLHPTLVGIATK